MATTVQYVRELADARKTIAVAVKATDAEKRAQKAISDFEKTVWFIPFTVAFVIDFGLDIFSVIPFAGIIVSILGLPFAIYMIIFNFRHGALRAKIVRLLILLVDFIPFVSLLWFGNIAVVFLMWDHMRRKKNRALKDLAKIRRAKQRAIAMAYSEAV